MTVPLFKGFEPLQLFVVVSYSKQRQRYAPGVLTQSGCASGHSILSCRHSSMSEKRFFFVFLRLIYPHRKSVLPSIPDYSEIPGTRPCPHCTRSRRHNGIAANSPNTIGSERTNRHTPDPEIRRRKDIFVLGRCGRATRPVYRCCSFRGVLTRRSSRSPEERNKRRRRR